MPETTTQYAKWFVLIVMVAIPLAYEAWALVNGKPGDSISASVWVLTQRPWFKYTLPVLWGALGMHFFMTPETWKLYLGGTCLGALTFLKKSGPHL